MKMGLIVALLLLASCEKRPSVPTATQNQQLNDAEKMLDDMARNETTEAN